MKFSQHILITGFTFCALSSLSNAMEADFQRGFNPITIHGFDKLHERGLTGKGQSIAFIEERQTKDINACPYFSNKSGPIKLYDYSRNTVWDGFEDCSSLRYTHPDYESLIQDIKNDIPNYDNGHDKQVMGLAIGHKTPNFCGGAAPEASGIHYSRSVGYYTGGYILEDCLNIYNPMAGMGLYSCTGMLNRLLEGDLKEASYRTRVENRNNHIKTKYSQLQLDNPVDASLYEALIAALRSEAKVVNISEDMPHLTDPFDSYKIPALILDNLGRELQDQDKILVVTPGNDFNSDPQRESNFITQRNCVNAKRRFVKNGYLNSLASHSIIKQHLLIPLNVYPSEDTFLNNVNGSNRPLNYEWGNCAVCAVGTDIYFGHKKSTGTSLSAPLISALCTIANQVTQGKRSAPEIVQSVKSNAIPLHDKDGDQEMFGWGLINPIGTIDALEGK